MAEGTDLFALGQERLVHEIWIVAAPIGRYADEQRLGDARSIAGLKPSFSQPNSVPSRAKPQITSSLITNRSCLAHTAMTFWK